MSDGIWKLLEQANFERALEGSSLPYRSSKTERKKTKSSNQSHTQKQGGIALKQLHQNRSLLCYVLNVANIGGNQSEGGVSLQQ